jgi:hypothetical protein
MHQTVQLPVPPIPLVPATTVQPSYPIVESPARIADQPSRIPTKQSPFRAASQPNHQSTGTSASPPSDVEVSEIVKIDATFVRSLSTALDQADPSLPPIDTMAQDDESFGVLKRSLEDLWTEAAAALQTTKPRDWINRAHKKRVLDFSPQSSSANETSNDTIVRTGTTLMTAETVNDVLERVKRIRDTIRECFAASTVINIDRDIGISCILLSDCTSSHISPSFTKRRIARPITIPVCVPQWIRTRPSIP